LSFTSFWFPVADFQLPVSVAGCQLPIAATMRFIDFDAAQAKQSLYYFLLFCIILFDFSLMRRCTVCTVLYGTMNDAPLLEYAI
jgi:hypothetical protein